MAVAENRKMMAVARRFMRPIARLAIRSSITCKDFAELCKAVFVEVACEDYGLQGRPANTSRVAILTGLSRKDVKNMRDRLRDGETIHSDQVSNASRVLGAWHRESRYLDAQGHPIAVAVDGKAPSFAALLKEFGGDMPPGALLKELKAAGAVEETATGELCAKKRYYMPEQLDPVNLERSGEVLHDMAETIRHNLVRDESVPSRFEGRASSARVNVRHIAAFQAQLETHGEAFLYAMDDWLSQHEVRDGEAGGNTVRLGVGVYQFEEKNQRQRKS